MAWVERINNKNNTGEALVDNIINKNNRIINKNNTSGDDSWMWPPGQPGKLNCILCQKVITFFHGSTNEFFEHIEIDHKIFINHSLLLSIIFLDNDTLDEIRNRFRQNLNALKVTGSAGLEETFVGDGNDAFVCDDGSFDDNEDEFDEDKMFHDFTKAFDQNRKETSFVRKEDFCNNQIEWNGVLENGPKYKPGPKSYKIKQLLKNKQERILSNPDNESENPADFKKNVKDTQNKFASLNENSKGNVLPLKNILESDINHDREETFNQHILSTKPFNNSEITNEALVTPNGKLSSNVKLNEAERVEANFAKINTFVSPGQNDQFTQKLKEFNDEILKMQKEMEDDVNMSVNSLNNFVDNDRSKVDDLYTSGSKRKAKRQTISEPYSNYEIKRMLKSYTFDRNVGSDIEMQGDSTSKYKQPLATETRTLSVETSERLVKSSVKELIKSLLECDEFDENNSFENDNSVKSPENQNVEGGIKNNLYFDNLYKDKDTKLKKLKRSVKIPKPKKDSDKDRLSSEYESDVKYDELSLNHEEIDSKPTNSSKSNKSEQSQNYGIKYPINVDISEYFLKRPNQLSGYNISESLRNQFVFDESLPNGWKIRRIWRENKKSYDTDYLSPDGRKARSKVAVLEYMKLLGIYSPEDYDKIIPNYELNLYKVFT